MTALAHVAPQQLEDARRVLRVLTAAFPTYPVADDTVELYLAVICADLPDFGMAMRVAQDWATTQLIFPKPVELVEAYNAELTRAQRRAALAQRSGGKRSDGSYGCPTCRDENDRMVPLKIVGVGDKLYEAMAPCPTCRPDDRDYWRDGHYDNDHDVWACEHPRCVERAKSSKRRRHS